MNLIFFFWNHEIARWNGSRIRWSSRTIESNSTINHWSSTTIISSSTIHQFWFLSNWWWIRSSDISFRYFFRRWWSNWTILIQSTFILHSIITIESRWTFVYGISSCLRFCFRSIIVATWCSLWFWSSFFTVVAYSTFSFCSFIAVVSLYTYFLLTSNTLTITFRCWIVSFAYWCWFCATLRAIFINTSALMFHSVFTVVSCGTYFLWLSAQLWSS